MKHLKLACFALLALLTLSNFVFSQAKISGYLQYMYRTELEENRTKETFVPGTINLKFSGALSENVKWEVQFGVKEMNFYKFLKDYYIELIEPIPIKGLELKFGQFKYYWSIERKESSADRKTIHRSQVVSALVADRDRGLEISYTGLKNLRLALGFWNGEVVYKNQGTIYETIDCTRNLDDSGAKKDITGFASYKFEIDKNNTLSLNASFLAGSNDRARVNDKKRYGLGLDAFLVNKNLHLRGEFIGGNDDDVKKLGYYLQLSYRFFDYFEPVVKYDVWDNNTNVEGKSEWLTLGLYSKVLKHVVFRLNYVLKTEKPIDVKNDELMFMVQVKF